MGNRASTARDEAAAAQSIGHFDHNYDAILIDQSAGMVEPARERVPVPAAVQRVLGDGRYVELVMKFDTVQLMENQRTLLKIPYHGIKTLEWDHSCSSVKITANAAGGESFVVVKVGNSLELESEAKLRIRGLSRQGSGQQLNLTFAYCGTYAGPTKPKPFQRKRANLSTRPQGKLPPQALMRDLAIARHTGSGAPTRANGSKRIVLALQHIHTGGVTFAVLHAYQKGTAAEHQQGELHEFESKLALSCGTHAQPGLVYVEGQRAVLSHGWNDVAGWVVHDKVGGGVSFRSSTPPTRAAREETHRAGPRRRDDVGRRDHVPHRRDLVFRGPGRPAPQGRHRALLEPPKAPEAPEAPVDARAGRRHGHDAPGRDQGAAEARRRPEYYG